MNYQFESMTATIVGLGLIGGSFAKSMRRKIPGMRIQAVDTDMSVIDRALSEGMIDAGSTNSSLMLKDADIVILCAYPKACENFLKENVNYFKKDAIITDTIGIKEGIVNVANALPDIRFVGGHPMAGRESRGYRCSGDSMFDNAQFILTPSKHSDEIALKTVQELVKRLGFTKIIVMDPKEHDKTVAFSSQLPHVLASALMTSDRLTDDYRCIAGSFRDSTRVADINPELWWELFYCNKDNMTDIIGDFIRQLADMSDMIKNGDSENLMRIMEKGRLRRNEMMR